MATWKEKIEEGNKTLMTYFEQGKADEIGNLYTEDCSVMPPGAPVAKGRKAASEVFAGAMKSGIKRVLLVTDESGPIDGNTAYERGHLIFYNTEGAEAFQGKYLVVWKEVDGKALLHNDTWNSDK